MFIPIITEADIDAYLMDERHPTSEGDPRDDFNDVAQVLYFLGWVAERKSFVGPVNESFGYETLLYEYSSTADAIAEL